MAKQVITRSYLETLSFSDLLSLADTYGIDVPEDFNHSFLITELLDIQQEISKPKNDMTISKSLSTEDAVWPPVYNTTEIDCILCTPAWAFVTWSINDSQLDKIKENDGELFLRICSFVKKDDDATLDMYTMQVSYKNKEQYILLPKGKEYVRFDLVAVFDDDINVLATSPTLSLPKVPDSILNIKIGEAPKLSKAMELSGADILLIDHYKQHRQAFS